MSPADARILRLRAELMRDWEHVQKQAARAQGVDPRVGGPEAAFVALALDHAYEAFEQLLLRTERALGLPERTGQHWHRALLADAARPVPGLRASIVPAQAEGDWAELLGFRHFLRHAYAAELDAGRLVHNVMSLERASRLTDPTIAEFFRGLEREGLGDT